MSEMKKTVAAAVMAGMIVGGTATVQAADVTVGADVVSAYVFRGYTFNDGVVVQPSVAVEHESGLALEVWSNFDIDDYDGALEKSEFSEVNFALSYGFDLDVVELSVGYTEYIYPGAAVTADREAFVGVGTDIAGLGLSLTVYQELSSSDNLYVELAADYGIEVADSLTLGVNGSVSYAGKGYSADGSAGFHNYLVGLSAEYALSDALSVAAFINYVGTLDKDVLTKDEIDVDTFGGIGVYYTF
jgi:hypothetical protein